MPPDLPRPRSHLPLLKNFLAPLPNSDEFYHSGELWDPILQQPVLNSFGPPPILNKRKGKMSVAKTEPATTTKRRKKVEQPVEPERSSQVDQLESDQDDPPPPPRPPKKNSITKVVKPSSRVAPRPPKASTSKRKIDSPPPAQQSLDRDLERFRCPPKGDGTPSSEVMNHSLLPLKRPRPSKQRTTSPPPRSRSPLSSGDEQIHETGTKKKRSDKGKGKERAKEGAAEEEEIVFYLEEVDEDGNPIEHDSTRTDARAPESSQDSLRSLSPSPRPVPVRVPTAQSHDRSPFRPTSPTKRTPSSSPSKRRSRSPAKDSLPTVRSQRLTTPRLPLQPEKSSPFRPARSPPKAGVPGTVDQTERLPFSSQSFVLPSQMVQQIRLSDETNPSSDDRDGRENADLTLVDPLLEEEGKKHSTSEEGLVLGEGKNDEKKKTGARLSQADQFQLDELIEGLGEGEMDFGEDSFDEDKRDVGMVSKEVEETTVEVEKDVQGETSQEKEEETETFLPSRSVSPFFQPADSLPSTSTRDRSFACPIEFLPTQAQPAPSPSVDTKTAPLLPPTKNDVSPPNDTRSLNHASHTTKPTQRLCEPSTSNSIHPQLVRQFRKPPPSHRLTPLTLEGVTHLVQELVQTALSSSEPLSRFGLTDESTSEVGPGEFGRGEVGYLRREVDRLSTELVKRDQTILSLSDDLKRVQGEKEEIKREVRGLEEVFEEVGRERDEEREKVGWMKEARKGLVRELKELEERCETLEREKG